MKHGKDRLGEALGHWYCFTCGEEIPAGIVAEWHKNMQSYLDYVMILHIKSRQTGETVYWDQGCLDYGLYHNNNEWEEHIATPIMIKLANNDEIR